MLKRLRIWTFVVLLVPAVLFGQSDDRLTLDLYLEMEGVSGPRISPDGSQIIYTRDSGWTKSTTAGNRHSGS